MIDSNKETTMNYEVYYIYRSKIYDSKSIGQGGKK